MGAHGGSGGPALPEIRGCIAAVESARIERAAVIDRAAVDMHPGVANLGRSLRKEQRATCEAWRDCRGEENPEKHGLHQEH